MAEQPGVGGDRLPKASRPPGVLLVVDDFNEIVQYKGNSRWYSRAGQFYVASRSRGVSTTMRCATDGCPAHWILRDGRPGPTIGLHNHEPTPWVVNRNIMFQALKKRVSEENIPLNAIYVEEAARYPDAAPHLVYESVLPSMRKWRRRSQPSQPRSLEDRARAKGQAGRLPRAAKIRGSSRNKTTHGVSISKAKPQQNDPLCVTPTRAKVKKRDEISNRCCCCMAEGKHENDFGTEYVEMFKNCLNMKLGECESAVICSACVGFLREVQQFRETVADTQARLGNVSHDDLFLEGTQGRSFLTKNNIKIETVNIKDEEVPASCSEESATDSDTEFKSELQYDTEYLCDWETLKDSETEFKTEYLCDWETLKEPEIEVNIEGNVMGTSTFNKEESSKNVWNITTKTTNNEKVKKLKTKITNTEQKSLTLEENQKVRSNIVLMLKHSTVLPFTHSNFVFKCFYCDEKYDQLKELKEHTETEHSDVTAAAISKIVRTMTNLTVAAETGCIRCKLCQRQFETIDNFIEHLKTTHKADYFDTNKKPSHSHTFGVDLSAGTFKCHLCNKQFPTFRTITVHMNKHNGTFVCYVCGKKFLSEMRYNCHMTKVHSEDQPCKCKYCGKGYKNVSGMNRHIKQKHLKRTIKCSKCDATFPIGKYEMRRKHMLKVHGMENLLFKCNICGKEYANLGSLDCHKKIKHGRKPRK